MANTVKVRNMRTKGLTKGKLKAFFTVVLGSLEIEDMKLIDGVNGLFLGFPSRSYEANGETKWVETVKLARDQETGKYLPASQTLYNAILDAAQTEYEAQGGAVPVKSQDDDSDDLPF